MSKEGIAVRRIITLMIGCFFLVFPTGCVKEKAAPQPAGQLTPQELFLFRQVENPVLIDTMSEIECRDHRIPGSLCLACEEVTDKLPQLVQDRDKPVVFYCESERCYRGCLAATDAKKLGYKRVYMLAGGLPVWKGAGYDIESAERIPRQPVQSLKPYQFERWLDAKKDFLIVDIRSEEFFSDDHLQGAVNVPMYQLHRRYAEIPQDRTIVLVDQNGLRSSLAASYLVRKNFEKVVRLFGGMDAWNKFVAQEEQKKKLKAGGSPT